MHQLEIRAINGIIQEWINWHLEKRHLSNVILEKRIGVQIKAELENNIRNILENSKINSEKLETNLEKLKNDSKNLETESELTNIEIWLRNFIDQNYSNHRLQFNSDLREHLYKKKNTNVRNINARVSHIKYSWNNSDVIIHQTDNFHKIWKFKFRSITCNFCLTFNEPKEAGKHSPKKYFIPVHPSNTNLMTFSILNKQISFWFEFRTLTVSERKQYRYKPQKQIQNDFLQRLMHNLDRYFYEWPEIIQNKDDFLNRIQEQLTLFTSKREPFIELYPYIKEYLTAQLFQFSENLKLNWFNKQNSIQKQKALKNSTILEESLIHFNEQLELFQKIIKLVIDSIWQIECVKLQVFNKPKFVLNTNWIINEPKAKIFNELSSSSQKCLYLDYIQYSHPLNNQSPEIFKKNEKAILSLIEDKSVPINNFIIDTGIIRKEERIHIIKKMLTLNKPIMGYCIKSENWQALKWLKNVVKANNSLTLQSRFSVIYIDPPYNTGNQDMIYQDKFTRAQWMTFIKNRLELSYDLLDKNGVFFSSIDDNELIPFSLIIQRIFPNTLNNIIWHKKTQPSYLSKELITVTEYIIGAKKVSTPIPLMGSLGNPEKLTELINIGNKITRRIIPKKSVIIANGWSGTLQSKIYGKGKLQISLLNGPISVKGGKPNHDLHLEGRFKWKQERINIELQKGGTVHIKSIVSLRPTIARKYDSPIIKAPTTLLSKKINDLPTNTDANMELKDLFGISPFDYSKPTKLIKYLIQAVTFTSKSGMILDFFAGSGTTGQAVIELNQLDEGNRQFYLIEKNELFNTVLLPRLKKLMYSPKWKNGYPVENDLVNGYQGIIQYGELEQFIDIWLNLDPSPFSSTTLLDFPPYLQDPFDTKHFQYTLIWESKKWHLRLKPIKILSPFGYWIYSLKNGIFTVKEIDLIQSLNSFLGVFPSKITINNIEDQEYIIIEAIKMLKQKDSCKHDSNSSQNILIVWQSLSLLEMEQINHIQEYHQKKLHQKYMEKMSNRIFNAIKKNSLDFDKIYSNGLKIHPKAILIESVFQAYINSAFKEI
ncbi:DNA methyltransferase [Candidatus Harpocratesius sp.]